MRHRTLPFVHSRDGLWLDNRSMNGAGWIAALYDTLISIGALLMIKCVQINQTGGQSTDAVAIALIYTVLCGLQSIRFVKTLDRKLIWRSCTDNPIEAIACNHKKHVYQCLTDGIILFLRELIRFYSVRHFGYLFSIMIEKLDTLLPIPLVHLLSYNSDTSKRGSYLVRYARSIITGAGMLVIAGSNVSDPSMLIHAIGLMAGSVCVHSRMRMSQRERRVEAASLTQVRHNRSLLLTWLLSICFAVGSSSFRRLPIMKYTAMDPYRATQSKQFELWITFLFLTGLYFTFLSLPSVQLYQSNIFYGGNGAKRGMVAISTAALSRCGYIVVYKQFTSWTCVEMMISAILIWTQYFQPEGRALKKCLDACPFIRTSKVDATHSHYYTNHLVSMLKSVWTTTESRRILLFLCINIMYMVVEFLVGYSTNSLGLIGDAGHMFFDNSALFVGLIASYIGHFRPNERYTYGYGRVEVLSGLLNSTLLLFVSLRLMTEAIQRFFDPPNIQTNNLLVTSIGGFLLNVIGLIWFHDHIHQHNGACAHDTKHTCGHNSVHNDQLHDSQSSTSCCEQTSLSDQGSNDSRLDQDSHVSTPNSINLSDQRNDKHIRNTNMYGIYLHVLADTLGSIGVIISSIMIDYGGWYIADPICSLVISFLIFGSTLPLFRDIIRQLMGRVPSEMEELLQTTLESIVKEIPKVEQVSQWHFWQHSNGLHVASMHLLVDDAVEQVVLRHVQSIVKSQFKDIKLDLTVQIQQIDQHQPNRCVQTCRGRNQMAVSNMSQI